MNLINVLKAMGDETRIRIVNILKDGPLCVCEIEAVLDITQSNASRHLNKLMNAGIVNFYKEAKFVYYKLNDKTMNEYSFIKEIIARELSKIDILEKDYEKLNGYKNYGMSCDNIEEFKLIYEKVKKIKSS